MATLEEMLAERERTLGAQPIPQVPQVQLAQPAPAQPQVVPEQAAAPDPLEAALAQREQELAQSGGFDSGVYQAIASNYGEGTAQAVSNFLGGVNERIATVLAIPGATVDAGLKQIGIDLLEGRPDAAKGLNAFKSAFTDAGINVTPEEGYAADIGRGTVDTALTTAALFAAAPAWAARTGEGVRKVIGDFITKNPALFAGGEIASVPGSVVGGDIGAKGGAAAGRMADQLAPDTTQGLGEQIGRGVGQLVGGTIGGTITGAAAPLTAWSGKGRPKPIGERIDPQGSPQEITRFAQEQIAGDLIKVDDDIAKAVALVHSDKTPEEASAVVRDTLEKTRLKWRSYEDQLWGAVDKDVMIESPDLRATVAKMREDTVVNGDPDTFPTRVARLIMQDSTPATEGATPKPIRAERMLGLRSNIRGAIRAEESKPGGGNRGLIRNMEALDRALMDQLAQQMPDNMALQRARQFSFELNDRFTRGPVADVLRQRQGGDLIDPGQTMQALLAKQGTTGSGVASALRTGDVPGPGTPALAAPNLRAEMEDAVRAQFQQIILSDDPELVKTAANNFLKQNRKKIEELGTVAGEMQQAVQGLRGGLERRKAIGKSKLATWAEAAPEKVVSSIFASNNPQKQVKLLMGKGMAKDPEALDGLRSQTIQHILRQSTDRNGNLVPSKFRNNLNPKAYSAANDAYREIFSGEQYRALQDIARDAAEADTTAFGKGVKAATIIGRVLGNVATGLATRAVGSGGGSIQLHAIGSKLAGDFTENQFKRMPAGELLELAILDPTARGILRNRAPTTAKEMRSVAARLRRFTALGVAETNREREPAP